jgi:hypothetical protein
MSSVRARLQPCRKVPQIQGFQPLGFGGTDSPAIYENQLVEGVRGAAGLIGEMANVHPGAMQEISKELHQPEDEQTRRMASTILAGCRTLRVQGCGG